VQPSRSILTTANLWAIPWLVSVVIHLTLLIALALRVICRLPDARVQIFAELVDIEEPVDLPMFQTLLIESDQYRTEPFLIMPEDAPEAESLIKALQDIELDIGDVQAAIGVDSGRFRGTVNGRASSIVSALIADHRATLERDIADSDEEIASRLDDYWHGEDRRFQTRQSCSIVPTEANEFVAEAKLGATHTILALDDYGIGRIAYYCDMTTLKDLMQGFPDLVRYLGQRQNPNVLVFGYQLLCQPLETLPGFEYAGTSLPQNYDGNPSRLARDYDVVIYGVCRDPLQFRESWRSTLCRFADSEGCGLLLVGDYYGGAGFCHDAQFEALNSIANDARARFLKANLSWGKAAWGKYRQQSGEKPDGDR